MGRQHFGGDLKGKWILTAGLGGMGGAQPLAAVMAGAHCIAIEVPGEPDREAPRDPLPRPSRDQHRRSAGDHRRGDRADQRRPARQCRRNPPRNGRARHPPRRGHRPDQRRTIPPTAIARPAGASPSGPRCASAIPRRSPPRRASRWPPMSRRCSPSRKWAFRPSTMATTSARKPTTRASPTPSISPASSRPMSGRCSAAASARSAGPRCRAIPRTSTKTDAKVKELIPDDPHLHRWLDMARERIAFQGLPARICWVGLGQRHRLGLAFNEMVRERRGLRPDRHRPRPSRQRQRRLAQPRDRGDAGRQRRGQRLAPAQRPAQHRVAARPGSRSTTAAGSAWAIRSTPAW